MTPLFLTLIGCSRDPEPEPRDELPVVELPTLEVVGPERGSFYKSGGVVLVQGTATEGSAPIARLEVNGTEVEIDEDGWFSTEIQPVPGINLVGVRVEDEGGERAVDGRSFHYGGDASHGVTLPGAVWMRLGPTLLDDNESTPNDLAAITELLVSDPSAADAFMGTRIEEDDYEVELTGIDWSGAEVDLTPNNEVLWADVLFHDVRLDFDVFGVGWYDWISTNGYITADQVLIQTDLVPNGTDVEVSAVYASITGFDLEIEWVPFESLLADSVQASLEETLRDMVSELAGDLVSDYLAAYAVTVEPFEGVQLSMELSDIAVKQSGLELSMDASVLALGSPTLPLFGGSLVTAGELLWTPPSDQPFAVAIDDDLVNQLLFAMWVKGGLSFDFDGDTLGALTGGPLPPPLGPVESASLSLGLPAVLVQGDEEHDVLLSLGEFVVDLERSDGERITASINAAAGGWLEQVDGELAVSLDDRPRNVAVVVGMLNWPEALDPGDLASLFRLMTPTLLGSAGAFMPGIPLPGIPLELLGEHPDLAGEELLIHDAQVALDEGWITVAGGVEVVHAP